MSSIQGSDATAPTSASSISTNTSTSNPPPKKIEIKTERKSDNQNNVIEGRHQIGHVHQNMYYNRGVGLIHSKLTQNRNI